ncbi:hypothetical protein AWC28_20945 [Mycolicibacter terrae]|nr:hypothetical protein AWC28_20945 [Mycolicibacter terrae]
MALSAEPADPAPIQPTEVSAVLTAEAIPDAWWAAPSAVHAAPLVSMVATPMPDLINVSLTSGGRAAHPGSAIG